MRHRSLLVGRADLPGQLAQTFGAHFLSKCARPLRSRGMLTPLPFEVFSTHDPELLAQYYDLRSRQFKRHYPGVPEDFGHEEAMDHRSEIVLACAGKRVCGGARLTVRYPGQPPCLPLEAAGFELPRLARHEHLFHRGVGEISRLAIERGLPGDLAALPVELVKQLGRVSAGLGLNVCFSICPVGPAELNRRVCEKCRIPFRIHYSVPARRHYGKEMRVYSYGDLQRLFGKGAAQ